MRKRLAAMVMAAVLAGSSMMGCAGSGNPASTAAREPQETAPAAAGPDESQEADPGVKSDVTYTLSFWHGATDDVRQQMYDNAISRFNKAYPNVTVEQTRLDSDAYKTKIKTVMGAGAADIPDVFMNWGGDVLKSYIEYGLVADITDLIAPYKDEYYDFEFGISTFDDRIYGMGIGIAPSVVFYNTEIFKDLNLDVPETWEELDTVCDTLKQAGYVPFALGNKNKWPGLLEYTMLGVNLGGQEMSKGLTDRTMSFDNEYFIEAGRRLADFSKKGYYPDGTNGIDHNAGGSRMLFYNEVAAMFIMTNGFLSNCVAEDAEFYEKVGTFPYPACNDSGEVGIVAGGNVFSISSQCEYPEMAADFLYYLTNADFSQDYIEAGNCFTGAKDVSIEDPLVQEQFDNLIKADWTQNFYDQQFVAELGEAFKDYTQALYGGTMTPEEVAAGLERVAVDCYGALK